MTEEGAKTKEGEDSTKTEDEEQDILTGEDVDSSEEKTSTTSEKPCDPATMTCDEMRDEIIDLTGKRTQYEDTIRKLEDIKEVLPSEGIDTAYEEAKAKRQEVDDEIYGTFEKFMVCSKPEPQKAESEKTEKEDLE